MSKYLTILMLFLAFSACAPLQEPEDPGVQPTEEMAEPSAQDAPLLTESGDSQLVVIHWQRSGGFAGICQEMDIFADGHAVVMDCDSGRELVSGELPAQERQVLIDWLTNYQQFTWKFNPPKGSADMFLDEYSFSGLGDQLPDQQSQEKINQELAGIAQALLRQPPTE